MELLAPSMGDATGAHVSEWRANRPTKVTRKRIVCPTLSSSAERANSLPALVPRGRHIEEEPQQRRRLPPKAEEPSGPEKPFAVQVRVLYFSRDGNQADAGDIHELQVLPSSSVELVLSQARAAAGTRGKGKLLFKMQPVKDLQATVEECGFARDPKALHLMVSRKLRPTDVAERAAAEEAELKIAMASAAAEAALRPKRERRQQRPATAESVIDEPASFR
eukprot:TRINITY_DN13657_c0_g1_i1.p1 TRINITY_DN13657_c0_g1~~TRINITY_DN13657_c0_g1_i1.p1  ORF type:complete len:221 (-),score=46.31 TRINITY_DN13657_c0_g1_i1:163-825(-)